MSHCYTLLLLLIGESHYKGNEGMVITVLVTTFIDYHYFESNRVKNVLSNLFSLKIRRFKRISIKINALGTDLQFPCQYLIFNPEIIPHDGVKLFIPRF